VRARATPVTAARAARTLGNSVSVAMPSLPTARSVHLTDRERILAESTHELFVALDTHMRSRSAGLHHQSELSARGERR